MNFPAIVLDWRGTLALTLSGPQWIQEAASAPADSYVVVTKPAQTPASKGIHAYVFRQRCGNATSAVPADRGESAIASQSSGRRNRRRVDLLVKALKRERGSR
jgi:hypothetical protein